MLVTLEAGKIIAEGTSQQLKTRLGNTVLVLTFLNTADAKRGEELIRDISSQPANVDGTVVEFTVDRGPVAAADALRRIDAANITLSGLTIREPSLDDVFLNLTGHKAEDPAPSDDDVTATSQSRKASS